MIMVKQAEKNEKHSLPLMQRGDFRREMRELARRCVRELTWNPEEDIAIIIARYNLDIDKIRKRVRKELTL